MKVAFTNLRSRRRIIELSMIPSLWDIVNGVRQEIGVMRAQLETTKFQIIQWLVGVVTGAGALGLGMDHITVGTNSRSLYSTTYLNGVGRYFT